jgi:hypothetical protein
MRVAGEVQLGFEAMRHLSLSVLFGAVALSCGGAAPSLFLEGDAASSGVDGGVSSDTGSSPGLEGAAPPSEAGVDGPSSPPESGADVAPPCAPCLLTLDYYSPTPTPTTEQIQANLQIVNMGTVEQNLANVTVRYWFTADGSQSQVFACDYAASPLSTDPISCPDVDATFVPVTPATATADTYLELSFAGGLLPIGGMAQIYLQFHDTSYRAFTQTNDYSFNETFTALTPWNQITMYVDGALVWGLEPR